MEKARNFHRIKGQHKTLTNLCTNFSAGLEVGCDLNGEKVFLSGIDPSELESRPSEL